MAYERIELFRIPRTINRPRPRPSMMLTVDGFEIGYIGLQEFVSNLDWLARDI